MKGYKVFDMDWKCRGMRYEIGKTYKHEGELKLCESGFHFCKNPVDCWGYKTWTGAEHMAEIEATGTILDGEDKCVTDEITIVREIPTSEMLKLCNTGHENMGVCNSGNWNTGDCNTGYRNTGSCNSGNWNAGNRNAGNRNTGNYNTGNRNTGNCNTGSCNSGNWNTGDHNSGNWNTGDWNTGNFCTKEGTLSFFDSRSDWTFSDWDDCPANSVFACTPAKIKWRVYADMNLEEHTKHPEAKTTGGYLYEHTDKEMRELTQEWWDGLKEAEKRGVWSLPNFNKAKFESIMYGIDIGEKPDGVPPQGLPETVFWHLIEVDGPPRDEEMHLVSTSTSKGECYVKVAYWLKDSKRWVGNIGSSTVYAWADIKPCEVI